MSKAKVKALKDKVTVGQEKEPRLRPSPPR